MKPPPQKYDSEVLVALANLTGSVGSVRRSGTGWRALRPFCEPWYSPRSLHMDHGSQMALYGSAAIEESLGVVVKREPLGGSGRLRGALLWP